MSSLLILGAGGHGRVVAETAELTGRWDRIAFLDDRNNEANVLGFELVGVLNDYNILRKEFDHIFVAIGDNEKRLNWIKRLENEGYKIPIIIHPRAYVSRHSIIQIGSIILAGAVINTNCCIGKGCIININASVDHDSIIDQGVHISPGATVRSRCKIGKLSFIGASSCVRSDVIIEDKFFLSEGKVI